eukprot:m.135005 g.135005  ORF g.135005 m.135005 type:complete len:269 (+) comp9803_c0_seq1:65-871(+)
MKLVLLMVATLVAFAAAQGVDHSSRTTCALTGKVPTEPRSLSFCHQFNDESCCLPGFDAENEELFTNMRDVGLSCRIRGSIRQTPLAKLYCLNCDPHQPKYVRVDSTGTEHMLICKDWASAAFGVSASLKNLTVFDECGLLISSSCLDGNGTEIPDRDRYTCGDDIVIPSNIWDPSLSEVLNLENFFNFPNLGTPNFDDFHYRVVSNVQCTDPQAQTDDPDCIRTQQQNQDYYGMQIDYPEMCFGSAASVSAMFISILLFAFAAVVFF